MNPETLVYTTQGLVQFGQLEVNDIVTYTDNSREIATEWRKGGELVRRDVWISILRGQSLAGEQASL